MLNEAQSYLLSAPWYALSAGVAIILLVLGFGLLSEGLGGDDHA
jgi:peptide/nickel transport system permease protein